MRKVIALTVMLLVGCADDPPTNIEVVDTNKFKQHPNWPDPVYCSTLDVADMAIVPLSGGKVAVDKEAILSIASCNVDVLRYIENIDTILCYYRSQLNEERCRNIRGAQDSKRDKD